MNERISDALSHVDLSAKAMVDIPANEQNISAIQVAIYTAILDIKNCLKAIAEERDKENP